MYQYRERKYETQSVSSMLPYITSIFRFLNNVKRKFLLSIILIVSGCIFLYNGDAGGLSEKYWPKGLK